MFRVIDTTRFDDQTTGRGPDEGLGHGLLVILDLAQKTPSPIVMDTIVRVHRPDGSSFDTIVNGIEIWGSNVGLFFRDREQHEIPISSEIEVVAG